MIKAAVKYKYNTFFSFFIHKNAAINATIIRMNAAICHGMLSKEKGK